MKKIKILFSLIFLLPFLTGNLFAQSQEKTKNPPIDKWWKIPSSSINVPAKKWDNKLPLIHVDGNKFVDANGKTMLFRGLNIADPDKVERDGHWNKAYFEKIKEWGATIIRIPVHPIAWRQRTPENYLQLLDQAVEWCNELGMYVIIDWHSIGNLKDGLFQNPMYDTSLKETFEFWSIIASHFNGSTTIAFYEIFNEPTLFFGKLGQMTWDEWKKINEKIILLMRAYDKETVPLVAGLDWAYDLTPLHYDPLHLSNIGYVTHPYPHKRTPPYEPKWEEDFGFAANTYPVIATEIGFTLGDESLAANGEYGKAIVNYLEGKGISWVAWVFDPDWDPQMIKNWNFDPTDEGKFFMEMFKRSK